jgi:hypothetical protein
MLAQGKRRGEAAQRRPGLNVFFAISPERAKPFWLAILFALAADVAISGHGDSSQFNEAAIDQSRKRSGLSRHSQREHASFNCGTWQPRI